MQDDKPDGQEGKADSSGAVSGEKPKKQPKVWVKEGAPATPPGASTPAAAASATSTPAPPAPPAEKAAAPAAKKPAKAEAPAYLEISEDPLVLRLQQEFPGVVLSAQSFLGQKILTVDASMILPVCRFLRDDPEWQFDMLEDLTALDYPDREKRFLMVYQLYSFPRAAQLRLKCSVPADQEITSVTGVWSVADWLEREVYDMFGIVFSGHPDLRRILLPEDWVGYPLRKDHDLRKQDEDWIRRHLQIRK